MGKIRSERDVPFLMTIQENENESLAENTNKDFSDDQKYESSYVERFHFPIPQHPQDPSAFRLSFVNTFLWGVYVIFTTRGFTGFMPIYAPISIGLCIFSCLSFLLSFI